MKLHYNPNQQYQKNAIESVVNLFAGEIKNDGLFVMGNKPNENTLDIAMKTKVIANISALSRETIQENMKAIQIKNKISSSAQTINDSSCIEKNSSPFEDNNFSVEMETGTGKTYVYLRTIFELNQKYNYKKFIIVVPSVAIREGVKNSLDTMREHFFELYNTRVHAFVYDSSKLIAVNNFATSNTLEIMIINIDAFAGDERILTDTSRERGAYIEYIQACNPILILDEAQNFETNIRKEALQKLNPLYTFRYSATHKSIYNPVYSLSPVEAYNQKLVKKIEIASVREENAFQDAYLKLISIVDKGGKNKYKEAILEIEIESKQGIVKKKVTLSTKKSPTENDIYLISGERHVYSGLALREIKTKSIVFADGKELMLGDTEGEEKNLITKAQIEKTIAIHFEKEKDLREYGIKVLSLFFIDEVNEYYNHDMKAHGNYAIIFEEIYERYRNKDEYKHLDMPEVSLVHDGYFAKDKDGAKNTNGKTKADQSAYERILKNKEKLLSYEEPLRFIFSHSALREGWDNPNVFQICVLRAMNSKGEKRQTIGRGLRLPVDQSGNRIEDENINILTIISNEDYATFAESLQKDIEEATGYTFLHGGANNHKNKKTITINKKALENKEFLALWEMIRNKTVYNIHFDTKQYIQKVCMKMKEENFSISKASITTAYRQVTMSKEGINTVTHRFNTEENIVQSFVMPHILQSLAQETGLSKTTLFSIIKESKTVGQLIKNPEIYKTKLIDVIRRVLVATYFDNEQGIEYKKINEHYEMSIFEKKEITYGDIYIVKNKNKTLYDKIKYDSSTIELPFAEEVDTIHDVKFFFKLPLRFHIDTPLGKYIPDWALTIETDKKMYFVAETKGKKLDELPASERNKIMCGKKHFKEISSNIIYKDVRSISELIKYK